MFQKQMLIPSLLSLDLMNISKIDKASYLDTEFS